MQKCSGCIIDGLRSELAAMVHGYGYGYMYGFLGGPVDLTRYVRCALNGKKVRSGKGWVSRRVKERDLVGAEKLVRSQWGKYLHVLLDVMIWYDTICCRRFQPLSLSLSVWDCGFDGFALIFSVSEGGWRIYFPRTCESPLSTHGLKKVVNMTMA